MTDVRIVVVELEELQSMIAEAVRAAAMSSASAEDWVTARTSGLGPRTFRRLARQGAFPVSKRGKAYVARRADVDAYIGRQRLQFAVPPEPEPPRLSSPEPDPIAAALAAGRLRVVKKPP